MSNENLWERFDSIAQPDEVDEAKSQFTPVEPGNYKMILEEITPTVAKSSGLPMMAVKMRIVDNNRIVFYNQMLQNINYPNMTAINIAEAVAFVSGILEEEISFAELGGLKAFSELISGIPIGTEHMIELSYGKKDVEKSFPKIKVIENENDGELPEVEGFHPTNDDIPF